MQFRISIGVQFILLLASCILCRRTSNSSESFYTDVPEVVQLNDSNFNRLVIQSKVPWIVEYYAPWCGYCHKVKDEVAKAARKLQGEAKIGALNCDSPDCKESCAGISGYPTFNVFKRDTFGKPVREAYNGARAAVDFALTARNAISRAYLNMVSAASYSTLFQTSKIPIVLIFSQNPKASTLYYAMAAEYAGKLKFEYVFADDPNNKSINETWNIVNFPALIAVDPKGQLLGRVDADVDFRSIRSLAEDALGVSADVIIREIDTQAALDESFKENGGLCVIALLYCVQSTEDIDTDHFDNLCVLRDVAKLLRKHGVACMWVNAARHTGLIEALHLSDNFPSLVVVNPAKRYYLPVVCSFDAAKIATFVETVVNNTARVINYSQKSLPLDSAADGKKDL